MPTKTTAQTFDALLALVTDLQARVESVELENARLRAALAERAPNADANGAVQFLAEEPAAGADEDEDEDPETWGRDALAARLDRLARVPEVIVRRRTGAFVPYKPWMQVVGGERDVMKLLGRCDDEPDTPYDQE